MSQRIRDLLDKSRFAEPAEVGIIREYVQARFNVTPQIIVQTHQIIIGVDGAALAGALRMQLYELQELCGSGRRLVIRISHGA